MTPESFALYLRKEVAKFGKQKIAAAAWNMSAQYLNDILQGNRNPNDDLLNRLGFERVVIYKRKQSNGSPKSFR